MILLLFIFLGGFFIIYSFFYFVVTRFHGDTLFKSIILLSRSRSNFFIIIQYRKLPPTVRFFFKVFNTCKISWRWTNAYLKVTAMFIILFFLPDIRTVIHIERVFIRRNVFHRLPAVEFSGHVRRTRGGRQSRGAHVLSIS